MHFFVLTAFPAIFDGPLQETILKRALNKEIIKVDVIGLRDFAEDKHLQLDDAPYGGGPGMVMKPEPIYKACESLPVKRGEDKTKFIFMSPQGATLTQEKAASLTQYENIVILCGRYKGVDQRVIDTCVDEEISIGDYVLSGGELPALVLIESISRLIPGVLGNAESAGNDSFQSFLLDCPVYTRPDDWRGMKVPEVLISGNHKKIAEWRLEQSIEKTLRIRKDLYDKYIAQSEVRKNE